VLKRLHHRLFDTNERLFLQAHFVAAYVPLSQKV